MTDPNLRIWYEIHYLDTTTNQMRALEQVFLLHEEAVAWGQKNLHLLDHTKRFWVYQMVRRQVSEHIDPKVKR